MQSIKKELKETNIRQDLDSIGIVVIQSASFRHITGSIWKGSACKIQSKIALFVDNLASFQGIYQGTTSVSFYLTRETWIDLDEKLHYLAAAISRLCFPKTSFMTI